MFRSNSDDITEWEAIANRPTPCCSVFALLAETRPIVRGGINEFRSVSLSGAVSIARSDLNSLSNTRISYFSHRCE